MRRMFQLKGVQAHEGYVQFIFERGSTKLRITPDLFPLDLDEGKVSVAVMDFFSYWFQTSLPSHILVCPSDFAISLRVLLNKTTSMSALLEFFEAHMGSQSHAWSTLIVPICDYEHWSLAILCDDGFLKFDSGFVQNNNFHALQKVHESLAKLWCIGTRKSKGSPAWKRASDIKSWVHVKCLQQADTWSCGFYVMCYMIMYNNFREDGSKTDWVGDVSKTFYYVLSFILSHRSNICFVLLFLSSGSN